MAKREDSRRVPQGDVLGQFAEVVDQRFQGIERTLEGFAMQLGTIEANQRTLMRYMKLDYVTDRRNEIMARNLSEALDAVRRANNLADGLIVQNNALREEIKAGLKLSPEQQEKIDAIFDDAEAQAKEITDAMAANTPNENPSGGSTGGAGAGGSTGGASGSGSTGGANQ